MSSALLDPTVGLLRYRGIVTEAIDASLAVDATPGSAAYLGDPMREYLTRPGKALRPGLCLATCEAFGGAVGDGVPTATALELLHNAFLVHDDVEDESELRRGEPTLHRRYGTALAVNAGDALVLHAMTVLRGNVEMLGPRLAERIMLEFEFMSRQTVEGQALELGWSRDNRLDLEPHDYLDLIMKKTCWYTTVLPLRAGALIGSWGSAEVEPMIEFGFHLGAAFQIRDDILNLVGDPGEYGKERLGDLREGKRTLMLIHLIAASDAPDRRWLEVYLRRPTRDRTPEDAEGVFELMLAYGSVGFAAEFAAGIARSAETAMGRAFAGLPDSAARRFVASLIPFMLSRAS